MTRSVLLAAAALAVIAALFFARPHATPGPPMRDFEAYYSAGTLWQHGADPYSTAIWKAERTLPGVSAQRYEVLPYVGPPALLPLWSALASLSFTSATTIWRGVLVIAMASVALLVLRLSSVPAVPRSLLAVAIAALGFGPLTSAVALGQVALPAFVFALLSLRYAPAGLFAWAQPNVALAMLSHIVRRTGAIAFACGLAAFLAGCAAIAGFGGMLQYRQVLQQHSLAERFSAIQLTPAAIAYGFGASETAALTIGIAVALAAAAVWILFVRRIDDDAARFAATCALLPLAMPFFHEHDLLLAFFPAVFFSLRVNATMWPIASGGALLCATDWLGLAQRPDGAVQTLLLVGAAGAALFALREDLHPRMLLIPASVLTLIAALAFFAQTHPAPVWPDAMRALPPSVYGLDISAVWHTEQAATGLLSPNAFWALLRCFSLLGCTALIYCGIANPSESRSRELLYT